MFYKKFEDDGLKNIRLILDEIQHMEGPQGKYIKITIRKDGRSVDGIATGNINDDKKVLLVKALLEAIKLSIDKGDIFALAGIKQISIASQNVIVVGIIHVNNDVEELLTGSCVLGKDINEDIVKAALHALNRRIALYLNEK